MKATVFYSWQNDIDPALNRYFIRDALQGAIKRLNGTDDTSGLPGTPDIASPIFQRIREARLFVCDVSIITDRTVPRPNCNPNVLIELGYTAHPASREIKQERRST